MTKFHFSNKNKPNVANITNDVLSCLYLEKNESGIHVRVCLEVENLQKFKMSQYY